MYFKLQENHQGQEDQEERKKVDEAVVREFIEETDVTIRGINDGSVDKECIVATAEKYNSLTDPTVNYIQWDPE